MKEVPKKRIRMNRRSQLTLKIAKGKRKKVPKNKYQRILISPTLRRNSRLRLRKR